MRVLIVKTSALGDIIHALPVLDYLHSVSPGIEIDWVAEEPFRDVLEGNPLLSSLFLVRTKAWRKEPFSRQTRQDIAQLRAVLRQRNYDMVFDIQGNLKSGLITWLSGTRVRWGFSRSVLQESINLLFTTQRVAPDPRDYHVTDQYLRLVSAPFGGEFDSNSLSADIATTAVQDAAAQEFLAPFAGGKIILLHTGTTWQTKFWTDEGWIALGKELLQSYPGSTLLFSCGNEQERETGGRLIAAVGTGARLLDRLPLKNFAAILKKIDLVVGGDTGPVHLAAAAGTPTVSLYRSSDGLRSGPRGARHAIIVTPLACSGCFKTKCERDASCRESITVEMMYAGCQRVLQAKG